MKIGCNDLLIIPNNIMKINEVIISKAHISSSVYIFWLKKAYFILWLLLHVCMCFPQTRKSKSNDINAQYNAHKSNKTQLFILRYAE